VAYKRFIVLLGIFLGSRVPAVAQTAAPQLVPAQERVAPTMTMLRTVSTASPATFYLQSQDPGNSTAHFSRVLVGAYGSDSSMERFAPMEHIKTLYFTQSSLPLLQLWGGRLQLGAFQSTFRIQNVQLGPLSYGGTQDFRRPLQGFPGGPGSIRVSGLSMSFHFGGDTRVGRPIQAWQRLSRIVGRVMN
jgi:hypothetical protein